MEPEIAIVGAGPVGSILALELARHGVPSVVIERSTAATRHPKMDYINARSMELLRRLGLSEELREVGVPTEQDFNFFWTQGFDREPVAEWSSGSVDVLRAKMAAGNDGTLPCEPYQRVIGSRLEDLTRRHCRDSDLVDLREGWTFMDLSSADGGVRLEIADRDGRTDTVRARFAVGCDGTNSAVRRIVGIDVDELGPVSKNCNVYFRCADPALLRYGRFFLSVIGNGMTLVSRDGAETWTAVFPLLDGEPFEGDPAPVISRYVGVDLEIDEVMSYANWENRLAVACAYRAGQVFLAGDAAHQFFPSGGHGANTGIADAVDLAWKLAGVVSGWAEPELLDSYEAERRPVALFNREMCFNLMEVWRRFIFLNRTGASRAQLAGYLEHQRFHSNNFGIHLGYRYNGSPIVAADGGPEPPWHSDRVIATTWPGARLPSVRLQDGSEIFDLLGSQYTLLDFSDSGAGGAIAAAAERVGVPVEHLRMRDAHARAVYERDLVLVRPDQHVAWRANDVPADVGALLARVAAAPNSHTSNGGSTMVPDTIDKTVLIPARRESVWAALTDGRHVGRWFGTGEPTRIDLRPGGHIIFDHGHGDVPAEIERVDAPEGLAYRWAVIGPAGEPPQPGNSTLVEITLTEAGKETSLRMFESGFGGVEAPQDELVARYEANDNGWSRILDALKDYVAGLT